ncbi:methyl-accepting chemotaxis protein [Marinomonas mediterranea]|jgi:methyl-accepting chemotaxis sensory transducer|uniref:Methyl-accepting chemotaxis sensory transducer n=1 Tax=Marinomonas mediterranea (strain ATCC 700492 / JCM 21426 / NBRC 103028 / MMB-1) TaxID=717774 RepID=F2JTV6_MARM1|nr:methyl-accepting chemotaxis protein [Marinomonas mediterranea]ADZ90377.1 methyl-accepting chemotaxis sensory transducer [Marinomonas mediterranea MMB-1]WCN16559.1 HAMP domain-containing protein [Marinomonas mediterranea MMB-1]
MQWMNNIKLSRKFVLLGILVAISVGVPIKFLIEREMLIFEKANSEILGVEPTNMLLEYVKLLQQHRGKSAIFLNDVSRSSADIDQLGQKIDAFHVTVLQEMKTQFPNSPIVTDVEHLKVNFDQLRSEVRSRAVTPSESFSSHTGLVMQAVAEDIPFVLEYSGLMFDSSKETAYLTTASKLNLPLSIEGIARLRGFGSGALASDYVTQEQIGKVISALAFIEAPHIELLHNLKAAYDSTGDPRANELYREAKVIDEDYQALLDIAQTYVMVEGVPNYSAESFFDNATVVIDELFLLSRHSSDLMKELLLERVEHVKVELATSLGIVFGFLILAVVASVFILRNLNVALSSLSEAARSVANGDYEVALNNTRKDEFGLLNQSVVDMSESLHQGELEREANLKEIADRLVETTRVEQALNAAGTNVVIVSTERKVIYANTSMKKMLKNAELSLRDVISGFDASAIVGQSIDVFNVSGQQTILPETLNSPYESNLELAGMHFRVFANPIFSQENERIGSVVEWLDLTSEVEAQNEIGSIVGEAARGNFTVRAKEEGKHEFMLFMAQSLNKLMTTADEGLSDVTRVLMALSNGNLTEKITQEYEGQFNDLKTYCNQTSENLASMIGELRFAAETINVAASEIAQGNSDLSNRTETQASSLEETASSMEEITSTVRRNADNASEANTLASEAAGVAITGGDLIHQVVETMTAINESSQKISDIIGVIDGIAFQTNILALNAAVEAARAGEQGRGFAVVASEVRTLAQRSANAAKDIKALISDSVSKIADGNELVGQSGETMGQIVDSIKRVNSIMTEIAAASTQQAAGVDEINRTISQMDEMTQQNAALVEEAAASAESMRSQANGLERQVSNFTLDSNAESNERVSFAGDEATRKASSSTPARHLSSSNSHNASQSTSNAPRVVATAPNKGAKAAMPSPKAHTSTSGSSAAITAGGSISEDDWEEF